MWAPRNIKLCTHGSVSVLQDKARRLRYAVGFKYHAILCHPLYVHFPQHMIRNPERGSSGLNSEDAYKLDFTKKYILTTLSFVLPAQLTAMISTCSSSCMLKLLARMD